MRALAMSAMAPSARNSFSVAHGRATWQGTSQIDPPATYAAEVRRAFEAGDSPSDFPAEGYEAQWPDRFATEQLNETGRRGLDLA